MIREATPTDVNRIVEMSVEFHSDAIAKSGLGFNPKYFGDYIQFLISNPTTVVLVFEIDNVIMGTIAGIVSPWFMGGDVIATEQWIWIDPKVRGLGYLKDLINSFIQWGKNNGANKLILVSIGSSTEEQVKRYYKKRGFDYLETHFIKEI